MSTFLRVLSSPVDDKGAALRRGIAIVARGDTALSEQSVVFEVDPADFAGIPGSPFVYWVSPAVRSLFRTHPRVEGGERTARHGGATLDDFRFLRLWTETPPSGHGATWHPFLKGGAIRGYWTDVLMSLLWADDGKELKAYVSAVRDANGWGPQWSAVLNGHERYGQPGITWSARPHIRGYFAHVPPGCVFSHTGMMLFGPSEDHWQTLALLNSTPFVGLLHLLMARGTHGGQTLKYESGYVGNAPLPEVDSTVRTFLRDSARRGWSLARMRDSTVETSHAFVLPAALHGQLTPLQREAHDAEFRSIQASIDDASFRLYGLDPADRAMIEVRPSREPLDEVAGGEGEGEDLEESLAEEEEAATADAVVSWLVGVAFGRFDPRLATGERSLPPEPEPFEPFPSRSPGMYPEGEAPARRTDVLVDDEGHADDLAMRALGVAERVKAEVPESLRGWLARKFFPLHIRMYSKSRRKAPIYWQLATPSAGYSVWLYIHAFTRDTLFRVQNDFVAPKVAHEQRRLELLGGELRDGGTAAQRRVLAAQEAFVGELRAFLEEVKRVVPLWNPDLDDGVIINFAPLWRLVPQHKAWQKELKATWDALCEGKYDWSHLAMHLWPERVVPKCAADRSFAIAHGLEEVFWAEGSDGKWAARKAPTRPIDELVRERTSPAVKAALKSLLEAPPPAGAHGARKGRRAKRAGTGLGEEA